MPDPTPHVIESKLMQSLTFIREANALIQAIDQHVILQLTRSPEEIDSSFQDLQKRVNNLFASLQNPTLIAATKLRERAITAGIAIDPRHLVRLDQGEAMWE